MGYPDNANFAAMEAQAPRYLSRDADADLAALDTIKLSLGVLMAMISGWKPRTNAGDGAHYALTNALDEAASAVRTAEDAIAEQEGVRL